MFSKTKNAPLTQLPKHKPGVLTSEFYLTLLNTLTGLAVTLGYLTPVQADAFQEGLIQMIGGAMVVFSTIAYIYSRTVLKKEGGLTSSEKPPLPMGSLPQSDDSQEKVVVD